LEAFQNGIDLLEEFDAYPSVTPPLTVGDCALIISQINSGERFKHQTLPLIFKKNKKENRKNDFPSKKSFL